LSAHSFARLMRWSIVFGLACPSVSLKSLRMRPSQKASIGLSGEMFSAVLRRLSHRDIYERTGSLVFCTHSQSSSNNVGRLDVPRKLAMKACRNSSHDSMDPGARLLSQALAVSLRCNCKSCIALSLEPPLTVIAVMKSSNQILGSYCPLNWMMPSLILSPFDKCVVRIYKLKHSTLQSPSLLTLRTICLPSPWVLNQRALRCARDVSTLCCARPCLSSSLIGSTM
jgi:hypothetical protein